MLLTRKAIRITTLILGSTAGLYLLLLLITGLYINNHKKSIIAYITAELAGKLRGKATISDLDISAWNNFPAIDFRLNGFVLVDSIYHQPVIAAQTLSSSLSLFQLIRGKNIINNLFIEDGVVHIFTDSTGYTNQYLLQLQHKNGEPPQHGGSNNIAIEHVRLKNMVITIEDKIKNKEISFVVNELSARFEDDGQLLHIKLAEKIIMKKGLGFNLAKGAFLENQALTGNWALQFDRVTKTLTFDNAKISINKHSFKLSGQFSFEKVNPLFRIHFSVKQVPYTNAKAIVSARIREKLDLVNVTEPLDADGSIEGSLLPAHEPAISINWQTKKNTLIAEAGRFSHCSFTGNFMNSVDANADHVDSNSRISFTTFSGDWDGIPFTANNSSITNLDTPRLQVHVFSSGKLKDLDDKLALQDIAFKSGEVNFDLLYDGPITKDKSMLQDIVGTMTVKNGTIDYVPRSFSFSNCNGEIALFKDSISMKNFNCNYLDNKFDVALHGTNIRKKFVTGNSTQAAMIDCVVRSPFVNLEDFTTLFGQRKQRGGGKKTAGSFAATARSIDDMLDNSVIEIHIKAAGLKRGNLHATDLEADVRFESQYWDLTKISLNIAGGSIVTSGRVVHAANNIHNALFTVKIDNADVRKLLFAFDNFGQDVLTHQNLRGKFSTTASLRAGINSNGKIMPASLKGTMDFTIKDGALQNFDPLNNLKSFVFKNRDMQYVQFAELKDKIDINGEDLFINRMEIQSSAFRLFLEGKYGLAKKNTDLLIQVPFSNLNKNSFTDEDGPVNKGIKAKMGASIWLRAVNREDGKVKVKLTMNKKMKIRS